MTDHQLNQIPPTVAILAVLYFLASVSVGFFGLVLVIFYLLGVIL